MKKTALSILISMILLWTATAMAIQKEEALVHFRRGTLKYSEGDVDGALAEFQLAIALNPSYKLFYNIGQCYMEQNRLIEAQKAFSQYLSEGGEEIPSDRRAEVEQTLAQIEETLSEKVPEDGTLPPSPKAAGPPEPAEQPAEPVPQEAYVPDPRAADRALAERPANMSERDWFGVNDREIRRYERVNMRNSNITLSRYLVDASAESKGLMWGEIAAGVLTGLSAGTMTAGYAVENYDLAGTGLAGTIFFGLGLTALLIIDGVDIGTPHVLYPERLDREIKAQQPDHSHRP